MRSKTTDQKGMERRRGKGQDIIPEIIVYKTVYMQNFTNLTTNLYREVFIVLGTGISLR